MICYLIRTFVSYSPSSNKKLPMDGGISDSWSQVLRWCVGGGERTMAGSLMKVHHPMRKISWKTPKPKVDFQKVVEFFVSFFSCCLVTRCHWSLGNLAFGKGRRASVLDQSLPICDGSNRKPHHLRFVWCGFRWFCYSFMHLRFFGGAHEAPGVQPGTFWHRAMWPARLVTTLMFSPPLWTVSGPRPSLVVFEGDCNPLAHRFLHQ